MKIYISLSLVVSALLAMVLCVGGCESAGREAGSDGNGSDGDTDSDSDGDSDGDSDSNICDEQDFSVEIVPTRVMLLFDVSGSMGISESGPIPWVQARDAITNVLMDWVGDDAMEFGFDFFPYHSIDSCAVGDSVYFDTTPGSAGQIIDAIAGTDAGYTGGATPLCAAMDNFDVAKFPSYAPLFTGTDANRYFIVVSDGIDMCGDNDGNHDVCSEYMWETTVTTALLDSGIKTYTIGFNGTSSSLTAIAQAGGTGLTNFIEANDQATLQAELASIAQEIVSCTFELTPTEEVDWEEVNIYIDDEMIGFDEGCADGGGWDWANAAHTQVVLCDQVCTQLNEGTITSIHATFGCPTVPIEII